MQYADGFPLEDVAWDRLSLDTLSQTTRLITLQINIEMRLPYVNQVQSSNAASHVLRSMSQAVSGSNLRGAFGNGKSRVLVIISSDYYVAGLAGLLSLHWTLPGYQPDFCAPGGALVFELRQSTKSKEYLVRAFYTAQTFDQLRNLTPLTLEEPTCDNAAYNSGGQQLSHGSGCQVGHLQKASEQSNWPEVRAAFRERGPAWRVRQCPFGLGANIVERAVRYWTRTYDGGEACPPLLGGFSGYHGRALEGKKIKPLTKR